jgi:hypothetical protein
VTEAVHARLGLVDAERTQQTTWFSLVGCVCGEGDRCQVYVGEFGPGDVGLCNVLIAGLAADPRGHLGDLANAFLCAPRLYDNCVRMLRKTT